MIYRFESEAEPKLPGKLKIEINTQEHFSCLKPIYKTFMVNSKWFDHSAEILTYELEELAATKLRALYQRKKGRDLQECRYAREMFRPSCPRNILA